MRAVIPSIVISYQLRFAIVSICSMYAYAVGVDAFNAYDYDCHVRITEIAELHRYYLC